MNSLNLFTKYFNIFKDKVNSIYPSTKIHYDKLRIILQPTKNNSVFFLILFLIKIMDINEPFRII